MAAPMVNGGWYNGQQYWNGQLGAAGVINNPNQQGYGQAVSKEVVAQTNPNNVAYLASKGAALPSVQDTSGGPMDDGSMSNKGSGFSGSPAVPNLQSIYDSSFTNNPNVKASQAKIADLNSQITAKKQALDTAQAGINDNPFYAEATRVGRSQKLTEQANNDLNTLTGQLNTEQTNYANLQAEAQRQVNLATGQYDLNRQSYQDSITQFNQLLSSGAFNNATPQDLAQISVQTGISPTMLQSIQETQKMKDTSTQIIPSTDSAGNVTITAVDKRTGQIISQEGLGAVGKASKGSGGSSGGKTDSNGLTKADYINYLSNDVQNKITLKSLVQHYQNYVPISTIYSIYASNSPWGAPKESLSDVKSGKYAD